MSNLALAGGLAPSGESLVALCACGCGTPVTVARWANRAQGMEAGQARQFVRGHNRRLDLPEPNPSALCMCGCGQKTDLAVRTNRGTGTVLGKPAQYIKGHARSRPHRLTSIDEENRTATCFTCGPDIVMVSQGANKKKTGIRWACRYNLREQYLRKHYNITPQQYLQMLEAQNYLCASCNRVEHDWDRPLHVDHNHLTGAVVALLCGRCNTSAGLMYEDPTMVLALLAYVEKKASM